MKNILVLLCIALLTSCNKESKKETTIAQPAQEAEIIKEENSDSDSVSSMPLPKKEEVVKTPVVDDIPTIRFEKRVFEQPSGYPGLLGYYVGKFRAGENEKVYEKNGSYSNKINLSIDHITKDSLYGHSVVAGTVRPFYGIFDSEAFRAKVLEPGDDRYDGVFEFTVDTLKNSVYGIWIANNSNLAVPTRRYNLERKVFTYNPTLNLFFNEEYDYDLPLSDVQYDESAKQEAINPLQIGKLNASTQELTNEDIENLNKGELEVLRNLIYARHGYSFKNRKMRYFFDSNVDWYIPVSVDIRSELTDLEKKNIDLIKRYEQHAARYYDYFGR